MEKIYKILGKRGRITIPYELRLKHGFAYNDVISFEETDKDTSEIVNRLIRRIEVHKSAKVDGRNPQIRIRTKKARIRHTSFEIYRILAKLSFRQQL